MNAIIEAMQATVKDFQLSLITSEEAIETITFLENALQAEIEDGDDVFDPEIVFDAVSLVLSLSN